MSGHDAVDVITTKRDRKALSDGQIDWVIDAYTRGDVADESLSLGSGHLRGHLLAGVVFGEGRCAGGEPPSVHHRVGVGRSQSIRRRRARARLLSCDVDRPRQFAGCGQMGAA